MRARRFAPARSVRPAAGAGAGAAGGMQLSEADNQADVMTAPYTYMHAGVDVSSRGRRLRSRIYYCLWASNLGWDGGAVYVSHRLD
jgi:hypothetical protein